MTGRYESLAFEPKESKPDDQPSPPQPPSEKPEGGCRRTVIMLLFGILVAVCLFSGLSGLGRNTSSSSGQPSTNNSSSSNQCDVSRDTVNGFTSIGVNHTANVDAYVEDSSGNDLRATDIETTRTDIGLVYSQFYHDIPPGSYTVVAQNADGLVTRQRISLQSGVGQVVTVFCP